MRRKKQYGKCHLCGKEDYLSFEHTPPRKAYNSNKAFLLRGESILEHDKDLFPWLLPQAKGVLVQGGIGGYTLCEKCNNNTGSWYGNDFVDFINKGLREACSKNCISNSYVDIELNDIYPLRILKQIITMFFSINNPQLSVVHPELRGLVLSKEKKGISEKDFGLYIYFIKIPGLYRRAGVTGIGNVLDKDFKPRVISELSSYPFGFILEFKPKDKKGFYDISYFANDFDYNQSATIKLSIPVYEVNTWFPLDYRKREEVVNDYIKNKFKENLRRIIKKTTEGTMGSIIDQ